MDDDLYMGTETWLQLLQFLLLVGDRLALLFTSVSEKVAPLYERN
jgi:hypothetical protein